MPGNDYNVSKKTIEKIKACIPESLGIKKAIAESAGISRPTLWKARQQDPEIDKMIEDENEDFGDLVETALIRGVANEVPALIMFALKTRFKDRGYTENIKLKGENKELMEENEILKAFLDSEEGVEIMAKLARQVAKNQIEFKGE